MSRFRSFQQDTEIEAGIDMSPMIDCVFILLIFFIVTTTFVEESGVEVDKPQAASSVSLQKNSIIFGITASGEVFFDNRNVGIAGVRAIVARKMLREKLPVIIQVDVSTPSGVLTRVIDEANLGNAPKVSIATKKAGS
ncbi:MAG: biopolymer transport protein ExbD [Planctomycetota bacterium]|jgi:biopolymer transport protein ExbD